MSGSRGTSIAGPPYRQVHTDLDYEKGKPFVYVPVDCCVLRGSCGSLGPISWGYVEWGELSRVYLVISCKWFAIWI